VQIVRGLNRSCINGDINWDQTWAALRDAG
jgi:hypothetical protein